MQPCGIFSSATRKGTPKESCRRNGRYVL